MTISLSERAGAVPPIEGEDEDFLAPPEEGNEVGWLAYGDVLLRRLAESQDELAANEAACKAELERVKNAWADTNSALVRRVEGITQALLQVATALKPFMRGKKSRALAFGTVGWRSRPTRLELHDDRAALSWIR